MTDLKPPVFRQRLPWVGGHLQTIRNALALRTIGAPSVTGRRLWIAVRDGSGDLLAISYTSPAIAAQTVKPLVLLIHGLTGCEDSMNQRMSADYFRRQGHPVVRLNMRGAGPGEVRASRRYHSGLTGDIATTIQFLHSDPGIRTEAGIVAMGVSLGGTILLNHLIGSGSGSGLKAAITVSTPLDLAESSRNFLRPGNAIYHRYLLRRMKAFTITAAETAEMKRRIAACQSVWEFDDQVISPWNGYTDATDYYRRCSPEAGLGAITTPALLIQANDDPWVPSRVYRELGAGTGNVRCLLSPRGGHVGFHGRGQPESWHNRVAAQFIDGLS
ncbi:MAG: alpha/beta fold hydrolase [Rhodospirillales bacterium]